MTLISYIINTRVTLNLMLTLGSIQLLPIGFLCHWGHRDDIGHSTSVLATMTLRLLSGNAALHRWLWCGTCAAEVLEVSFKGCLQLIVCTTCVIRNHQVWIVIGDVKMILRRSRNLCELNVCVSIYRLGVDDANKVVHWWWAVGRFFDAQFLVGQFPVG